ncbi:MAG: NAD(P)/FAD-dependent oxidoreductase [Longimicrobiales bacterium]
MNKVTADVAITDVAIIGAGFAGVSAAHALSSTGVSVALIDRQRECPDVFRAEKIEPDQAVLMRELGLLDLRAPHRDPIGTTLNFDGRETVEFDTVEQYGISYADTVNSMRSALGTRACQIVKRVQRIDRAATLPKVVFDDGTTLTAKLVVLATGGSDKLIEAVGLRRTFDRTLTSLSFGFDIERTDGATWPFHGFNYLLEANPGKLDYVTIFPIGDRMRVNLFTQMGPKSQAAAEWKRDTLACLDRAFPGIHEHIGPIRISSTVQVVPTTFYRLQSPARAGLVVIGDEYQGVSPATGTGLSRVLSDVRVLCTRHAPSWLSKSRVSSRDVKGFYTDADKVAVDRKSLDAWRYYHDRQAGGKVPLATRVRRKILT